MKSYSVIFFFIAAFALAVSCAKDRGPLDKEQEHLVGTWVFEKVKTYRSFLKWDNITDQYASHKIHLNEDLSMEYEKDGQTYSGKWRLEEYTLMDDQGVPKTDRHLIMMLVNNGEIEDIAWENVYVTNKKLTASKNTDDDKMTYNFTLVKQ